MNNVENFFKKTKEVKLSSEEKEVIRGHLLERINRRPTAIGDAYRWFVLFSRNSIAASCMFVIFFIGGTSVAAEASLPGDLLYPLKVGVNEQVRSWFAVSKEAEAAWEVRVAERRFEELEGLQEKNISSDFALRSETEHRFEEQRRRAKELLIEERINSIPATSVVSSEKGPQTLATTFQEKRIVIDTEESTNTAFEYEEIQSLKQEVANLAREIRKADSASQYLVRARLSLLSAKDLLLKIDGTNLEENDIRELIDDTNLYIQITKDQLEKVYNEKDSSVDGNEGAAVKALKKNKTSPEN